MLLPVFSPSKRGRAKALRQAQGLLGDDAVALSYGVGVSGPDPARLMIAAWVIALVVTAALVISGARFLGAPLLIVALVVRFRIQRPRGIVVTDRGVASLTTSPWNGIPTAVLTRTSLAALTPIDASSRPGIAVGNERIWMTKREHQALTVALPAPV